MDGPCGKILKNYPIKASHVKKTRGFYIISDGIGKYALKKSADTEEHLEFQVDILARLKNRGFDNIEMIYRNLDGKIHTAWDGEHYILTDYIDGEPVDFDNREHLDKIMEIVSFFHEKSSLESYPLNFTAINLKAAARGARDNLAAISKRINPARGLSEFDVVFLRNYGYYMGNAEKALDILNSVNYDERRNQAIARGRICHNLLKRENLIIKNKELWLTSFSGCRVDYYTSDLAMIVERYMKYTRERQLSAEDVLALYAKRQTVDRCDMAIVLAGLLLPESFLKAASRYYSKKRTWAPTSLIHKLETAAASRETLEAYVKPLREYSEVY